jgi:methionyl aminopeptidase
MRCSNRSPASKAAPGGAPGWRSEDGDRLPPAIGRSRGGNTGGNRTIACNRYRFSVRQVILILSVAARLAANLAGCSETIRCGVDKVDGFMKNRNNKVGRNAPCPCGSGRKYKKCCSGKPDDAPGRLAETYARKYRIRLKDAKAVDGIRAAGRLAIETLNLVERQLQAGMSTNDINTIVHDHTLARGAVPAPLNYKGFPKSVCTSVNDVICHGIPGPQILGEGDIVNVDVTPILNGYYADVNKTFCIGSPGEEARKIVTVALNCLKAGMAAVRPGNTLGDIGWAIQQLAEGSGCSVVREFVGHGVGFDFHEPPQVLHYGERGDGIRLVPGMVFTIEPMINLGGRELRILGDDWTAVTADGSLSAQFEQTVLVTDSGCESLTPFDFDSALPGP